MDLSIKISNLYKEYNLGLVGNKTLYRDLQSLWASIRGMPDPNSLMFSNNKDLKKRKFLALKDINFEVKQGEVLGIIGRNGAGKSTLLKILSKITAPTSGNIFYNGRIASLLEVGTGFHGELTGRENIFLNGSINGMNNKEISKKLDEIVDFAGVEKFLDTPVKRYSSGMHVRLGFSVAAHLEPDILLVDEVLAVGDANFKEKAIKKMKSVSSTDGITVVFVSHNMDSIKDLCSNAILLNEGKLINSGKPINIIDEYLKTNHNLFSKISSELKWNFDKSPGNDVVNLLAIRSKNNQVRAEFLVSENFYIEIDYNVKLSNQIALSLEFINDKGVNLFVAHCDYIKGEWGNQLEKKPGNYRVIFEIPKNLFNEGMFFINLNIYSPPSPANFFHLKRESLFSFKVHDNYDGSGSRGSYPFDWGLPVMRPKLRSTTNIINS